MIILGILDFVFLPVHSYILTSGTSSMHTMTTHSDLPGEVLFAQNSAYSHVVICHVVDYHFLCELIF